MKSFRTAATVDEERQLHLRGLPFDPGEEVEVVLHRRETSAAAAERYPLRGLSVRYEDPFEPVAAEDWEASR